MSWVTRLFNDYFTSHDKLVDVNRDVNGVGTFERYIGVAGLMLDEEIVPRIEQLQTSTLDPYTAQDRYVSIMETALGVPINIFTDVVDKRRLVAQFRTFTQYKGTTRGYELMYNLLGVVVDSIIVNFPVGQLDLGTFDNPDRTFDMACSGCVTYEVELSGNAQLTAELSRALLSIEQFNRPVDAVMLDLRYNGQSLILLGDFNDDFNDDFYTG